MASANRVDTDFSESPGFIMEPCSASRKALINPPVVQYDIRKPELVGRHTEYPQLIVVVRIPANSLVDPALQRTAHNTCVVYGDDVTRFARSLPALRMRSRGRRERAVGHYYAPDKNNSVAGTLHRFAPHTYSGQ